MSQIFSYAALTGISALVFEAIILLFKTETIERVLLNDRKKLLLDFTRVTIIGFGISLILHNLLIETSMKSISSYVATFVISWLFGIEIYYIAISIFQDIGFGKNYFIEDEQYGKLYLIKSSNNKYILLADKPLVKDSTFIIYKDESVIEGKKIFAEAKKIKDNSTKYEKIETSSLPENIDAS